MYHSIQDLKTNIAIAEKFYANYSKPLQDLGRLSIDQSSVMCFFDAQDCAQVGEVFGRDSWTRTPAYGGKFYDWRKTVDNVILHIHNAEEVAFSPTVRPQAFPVLLKDTSEDETI